MADASEMPPARVCKRSQPGKVGHNGDWLRPVGETVATSSPQEIRRLRSSWEPCAVKVARTLLRGEKCCKAPTYPTIFLDITLYAGLPSACPSGTIADALAQPAFE